MTIETTARLKLPLLAAGQAQKELAHNEALALIDFGMNAAAESLLDAPPAAPIAGRCWIVGSAPAGAWTGQAGALACWTTNGWRFLSATEGMRAWVKAATLWAEHRDGAWVVGSAVAAEVRIGGQKVVGSREAAIGDPAGGSTVDAESRAGIVAILSCLRTHGLIAS